MEIEEDIEDEIKIVKKEQNNLPWVEKYRPSSLRQMISHDDIVSTIQKFIDEKTLPNLLLYGPPGTGKTSTIIACAKELYQHNYKSMVLELNASDDRGINVVREEIKSFSSTQQISFGPVQKLIKLIILDEADQMTQAAQFALRRIMEKYANNTRFCLICNYVTKIIPALQSRCTRFKFKSIPFKDTTNKIKEICQIEQMNLSDDAIEAVQKLGEGDLRKIINMLQSINLSKYSKISTQQNVDINADQIYKLTGAISPQIIKQIIQILFQEDEQNAFLKITQMQREYGLALSVILTELSNQFLYMDVHSDMKMFLYQRMAELEYRLSINCDEKIQLSSLIGAFIEVRHIKQTK